jgi:hypothetical protein
MTSMFKDKGGRPRLWPKPGEGLATSEDKVRTRIDVLPSQKAWVAVLLKHLAWGQFDEARQLLDEQQRSRR